MSSTVSCSSPAQSVGRRHAQVGEDLGHRQWVRDVGLTAAPQLGAVLLLGHLVRAFDDLEVGLGVHGSHRAEDRLELGVARAVSPTEARQGCTDARLRLVGDRRRGALGPLLRRLPPRRSPITRPVVA